MSEETRKLVSRLRIFTQVHIFMDTVKRIEFRQKIDLSVNLLHSYVERYSISVFISGAPLSSPTRHSFPPFFVKHVKENQDCIVEIISRYIIHLKITKYNNSANKTGI